VYCVSVSRAISFLDKEYDIVLMDPPYANRAIGEVITHLASSKLVGKKTTVIITHSPRLTLEQSYGELNLIKENRHGDSCINIYRKEARP
jgi:16S rRNA G966 N2-methylase RsmD